MFHPIGPSIILWFSKIAFGLESLDITLLADPSNPKCLAPQLLTSASAKCLNLQDLDIETLVTPLGRILPSVGLFGQIRALKIRNWDSFACEENETAWSCLRGLTSLQVDFLLEFI